MAYSGDTAWTDVLIETADNVDLFLCEGYSLAPVRWHLDLETLTRHRDQLTCRQLGYPPVRLSAGQRPEPLAGRR